MSIVIHPYTVPLRVDETGTIRVGNTRITLDVFLADHRRGWTPEQIVEQLDTLTLPDVYGALAYYYKHQTELDEYLRVRREEADRMQREIEATQPTAAEVKAWLLAKKQIMNCADPEERQSPATKGMTRGRWAGTLALVLLLGPVLWAVWVSFTPDEFLAPPTHTWSLRWYVQFFRDERWLLAAGNSLLIASLAAGVALVAGTLLALAMAQYSFHGRRLLTAGVLVPLVFPPVVLGLGLLPLASALGLTHTRLLLVLAHALLGLGVVFLVVRNHLEQTSPDLELAARGLGAGPIQTFLRVTLPQLMPALGAGTIMAFLLSLNESVLCVFLGGPETETLPQVIWPNLRYTLSPLVAVASSLTMLLTGAGLLVVRWLVPRRGKGAL